MTIEQGVSHLNAGLGPDIELQWLVNWSISKLIANYIHNWSTNNENHHYLQPLPEKQHHQLFITSSVCLIQIWNSHKYFKKNISSGPYDPNTS